MEKKTIGLYRAGGLGDIVAVLNTVPKLRLTYDEIHLYRDPVYAGCLDNFLLSSGLVDELKDHGIDWNNIKGLGHEKFKNCYGYTGEGEHLILNFGREVEENIGFNEIELDAPEIPKEILHSSFITIHVKAGWSIYKNWWGWQELVDKIKEENPQIGIYQIGSYLDPTLLNIDDSFLGESFEKNLAAQAHASLHLGVDSVFNHTSNFIWNHSSSTRKTKAIILFGSTSADFLGYPDNVNISLGLHCQPCGKEIGGCGIKGDLGGLCDNPPNQTAENPRHSCMEGISVDKVYGEFIENV